MSRLSLEAYPIRWSYPQGKGPGASIPPAWAVPVPGGMLVVIEGTGVTMVDKMDPSVRTPEEVSTEERVGRATANGYRVRIGQHASRVHKGQLDFELAVARVAHASHVSTEKVRRDLEEALAKKAAS